MKNFLHIIIIILIFFISYSFFHLSLAGSLSPNTSPSSTMYTLDNLYNKITSNTYTTTEGSAPFTTPNTVSSSFRTLKEVYESIPTLDASQIKYGVTYMGVTGTLLPISGLPKTGQVTCLDITGVITCTGTGQDADYQAGVSPAIGTHFTDNSDSTITDNATTLMWKKCSEGLSDSSCGTGSATTMDWATALSTCEADTTAGYTNWRLPNRFELLSIVDIKFNNSSIPSIDTTYFPSTQKSNYLSSTSSQIIGRAAKVWVVDFTDGFSPTSDKTASSYVRCVR